MAKTLRNNGIFSEREYKGKSVQEAIEYAEAGGFVVRITEIDGKVEMVNAIDYKDDRLNFRVANGRVIGVHGG